MQVARGVGFRTGQQLSEMGAKTMEDLRRVDKKKLSTVFGDKVCACVCTYICTCVCMYACVHGGFVLYVCVCMLLCVMYVNQHASLQIHACTYIRTRTITNSQQYTQMKRFHPNGNNSS